MTDIWMAVQASPYGMYSCLDLEKKFVLQQHNAEQNPNFFFFFLVLGNLIKTNKNVYLLTNTQENCTFEYTHTRGAGALGTLVKPGGCTHLHLLPYKRFYFLLNKNKKGLSPPPRPFPGAVYSVSDNARLRCLLECLSLSNALIILAAPLLKSPWTESDMERIEFHQGWG